MSHIEELEKLGRLYKNKVISKPEFETQKELLLKSSDDENQKSQTIYVFLAFFLGTLGVHNFYAGYMKKGWAQLLITVLSLGALSFVSYIWALVNILTVEKDAAGISFKPAPVLKLIIGIFSVLILALLFLIMLMGGIAGYTMAMSRNQANRILDYTAQVSALAHEKNIPGGACADVLALPDDLKQMDCRFIAQPNGGDVFRLENADEEVTQILGESVSKSSKQGNQFLFIL